MLKKVALAALLITSISAQAASVWKVTNGENTVFFGGTIHILKANNLPLPSEFDKAYAAADILVFETDIEGTENEEFQQKMMSKVILTDGTTLQTRLSEETYAALKTYLDAKGLPIINLHLLKPSMVALTITMLEFQANGFTQDGVDKIFAKKARQDGKKTDWFESIDEQLDFIANMGGDDDDGMIKYTLEEIESLPTMIDDMLSSWLAGDLEKLNETLVQEMANDFPEMYEEMLVKRNDNWMPKIIELLNDKPTEFVLVGTAHLAGKDSVFAKLEAKGFKIEKLK
ncbi:MAG: hypothetical protein ACI97K_001308 [Glaciecola sp.]|jgi:uncharacterized protein YbaP (TraB family)